VQVEGLRGGGSAIGINRASGTSQPTNRIANGIKCGNARVLWKLKWNVSQTTIRIVNGINSASRRVEWMWKWNWKCKGKCKWNVSQPYNGRTALNNKGRQNKNTFLISSAKCWSSLGGNQNWKTDRILFREWKGQTPKRRRHCYEIDQVEMDISDHLTSTFQSQKRIYGYTMHWCSHRFLFGITGYIILSSAILSSFG